MTTITLSKNYVLDQSLKTATTILVMVATPFLVHLIPFSGSQPLGAYLLPMFIAPLVAAVYVSPVGLALAAIAAPLLNHALTGMPALPGLYPLMAVLVLFSLFISLAIKRGWRFLGISTVAFLFAKLIVFAPAELLLKGSITLQPFQGYLTGLTVALPGLLVLLAIEWVLIHKPRR